MCTLRSWLLFFLLSPYTSLLLCTVVMFLFLRPICTHASSLCITHPVDILPLGVIIPSLRLCSKLLLRSIYVPATVHAAYVHGLALAVWLRDHSQGDLSQTPLRHPGHAVLLALIISCLLFSIAAVVALPLVMFMLLTLCVLDIHSVVPLSLFLLSVYVPASYRDPVWQR